MNKIVIWNSIQHFPIFLLYAYSISCIGYYKYCLNQQKRSKEYSRLPSIFNLAILILLVALVFYLTKIAYDRFCISISEYGLLFIPIAFIPLAAILYSAMLFFQKYLTRSTEIYFILPDVMVAMIQKVLTDMGWKDIQVSHTVRGQTTLSDPDKKYIVQVRSDQVKHTIRLQPTAKTQKIKSLTDNFRKLLLREQVKSTYPIDPEMVLHFKKKYLWLYILSWFSFCLCIYLFIFH